MFLQKFCPNPICFLLYFFLYLYYNKNFYIFQIFC
nr:MAG TPA: hypothetical protein [Caudoviricetes sp.]DAT53823.1 MAG TPA: hypothetical protein [Caudoviricetes sp.]